jgi:hypothetical protein
MMKNKKTQPSGTKVHLLFLVFLLSIVLTNESGCYTASLTTQDALGTAKTSIHGKLKRRFWGLLNSRDTIPQSSNRGLHSVELKTTFGEGLVTVLTLGISCPVDYYWTFYVPMPPKPIHKLASELK